MKFIKKYKLNEGYFKDKEQMKKKIEARAGASQEDLVKSATQTVAKTINKALNEIIQKIVLLKKIDPVSINREDSVFISDVNYNYVLHPAQRVVRCSLSKDADGTDIITIDFDWGKGLLDRRESIIHTLFFNLIYNSNAFNLDYLNRDKLSKKLDKKIKKGLQTIQGGYKADPIVEFISNSKIVLGKIYLFNNMTDGEITLSTMMGYDERLKERYTHAYSFMNMNNFDPEKPDNLNKYKEALDALTDIFVFGVPVKYDILSQRQIEYSLTEKISLGELHFKGFDKYNNFGELETGIGLAGNKSFEEIIASEIIENTRYKNQTKLNQLKDYIKSFAYIGVVYKRTYSYECIGNSFKYQGANVSSVYTIDVSDHSESVLKVLPMMSDKVDEGKLRIIYNSDNSQIFYNIQLSENKQRSPERFFSTNDFATCYSDDKEYDIFQTLKKFVEDTLTT